MAATAAGQLLTLLEGVRNTDDVIDVARACDLIVAMTDDDVKWLWRQASKHRRTWDAAQRLKREVLAHIMADTENA